MPDFTEFPLFACLEGVFLFAYALLIISIIFLGLRVLQLGLDAIYLLFYFGILLVWPYPEEMVRFLHPVFMLLLLQPMLFLTTPAETPGQFPIRAVAVSIILVLCASSLIIQHQLVALRNLASKEKPAIAHSYEYYALPDRDRAMSYTFQAVMMLMTESAEVVPEGSTVAAVKHEAYTLLAGRESVKLPVFVPHHQQLCYFKAKGVDFVFLSPLLSRDNSEGLNLVEQFRNFSVYMWSMKYQEARPIAYVLKLDPAKIDSILTESGFDCLPI